MHRLLVWSLRIGLVGCIAGAWLFGTGPGDVSPLILPPLPDVLSQFLKDLQEHQTYSDTLVTVSEILGGFVIAVALGLAAGFWCARRPLRAAVYERVLAWGYLVPHLLFYPLFIMWFGIGPASKTAFAVSAAFFPMAFNTLRGFQNVDKRYLRVADAFQASPTQTDLLIKFPAALPLITAGVRIAAAICTGTVILTEMLAAQSGLGYQLTQLSTTFFATGMFAIVLVLLIVVAVLQTIVQRTLRPRWSESRGVAELH